MSEKSVTLLEDIRSSQADPESVVGVAVAEIVVSPFPLDAPEEKVVEIGEESPVRGPKGPVEDVCETEAGTEADLED